MTKRKTRTSPSSAQAIRRMCRYRARLRHHVTGVASATALSLALLGCGTSDDAADADASKGETGPSPTSTSTSGPAEPSGETTDDPQENEASDVIVNITVRGDDVQPVARRVQAHRGQEIVFQVDADRSGGLHIHSSPEQTIDFTKGKSILSTRIKVPGVVDVEEHEADALVAQIEVR